MSEAQNRRSAGRGTRKSSARGAASGAHGESHEAEAIGPAEGALSILSAITSDRLNQLSKRQLIRVIEDLFAMLAKTENEREKRFDVVLRTMLGKQEERKRTTKEKENSKLKTEMGWLEERRQQTEKMAKECERDRAASTIQTAVRKWLRRLKREGTARQIGHAQRPPNWSPRGALKRLQAEVGPSFERHRQALASRHPSEDFTGLDIELRRRLRDVRELTLELGS